MRIMAAALEQCANCAAVRASDLGVYRRLGSTSTPPTFSRGACSARGMETTLPALPGFGAPSANELFLDHGENFPGNGFLAAGGLPHDGAGGFEDFHGVFRRADRCHAVRHHKIAVLAFQLRKRPQTVVIGLQ